MKNLSGKKALLIVVIFVRLFIPFLIFKYPLLALVLSLIFDHFDGQLFFELGYRWEQYNLVDKLLDTWWYLFILLFFWGKSLFLIALLLFVFRAIGVAYIIKAKNVDLYLIFPNVLEKLFFFTLIFPKLPLLNTLIISYLLSLTIEWINHKTNIHFTSKYIFHNEIDWKRNVKKRLNKR